MRELNTQELNTVAGGSLSSIILDFINQVTSSSSSEGSTEWTRPDSVPAATPASASEFGMRVLGIGLLATFAVTAFSSLFKKS